MPCHTRMKSVFLQGLLWLYLLEFGFIAVSLEPGYLDFDNLPDTNFSCVGKVIGGYYADLETSCQMFHVCTIGQLDEPMDIRFLCLNGTVFDQETRVCERIDEVDCSKSEKFYHLNLELYGNTQPPILEESPETDPPQPKVKTTTTTTTTTTPKPSFYTTARPVTTTRSKTISSHHFPVATSSDIRFNPEEINISLNPNSPPTIRTKPVSFQQQRFSNEKNKHIIVTHTTAYADDHKEPEIKLEVDTPKIAITTGQPKINYGVSPKPTEINSELSYQQTEGALDYDTELPQQSYQYHPGVPHFHPTAGEVEAYNEQLYKSSTYRAVYHTTTPSLKLYHHRPSTFRTQHVPKPHQYHYQRTEKPTRLPQQPLPLFSTLRPLTFSSPAPFSSKRHIETKRNADHQVSRIIISSSGSGTVVDPTGRILNYSIGDTHMLGRTPPASYDDYKEDDISLDPFYRDVPKLKNKVQKARRQRRSAKEESTALKTEDETVDALKFLLNWYSGYEQTTKISIPLASATISEINNELSAAKNDETNETAIDHEEHEKSDFINVTSSYTGKENETGPSEHVEKWEKLENDTVIESIKNETKSEVEDQSDAKVESSNSNLAETSSVNRTNGVDYVYEDDYEDEGDEYETEQEKEEWYQRYKQLNERIGKIFANDYVDSQGQPLFRTNSTEKEAKMSSGDTHGGILRKDAGVIYSKYNVSDGVVAITKEDDSMEPSKQDVQSEPTKQNDYNQTNHEEAIPEDYVDDNYEVQLFKDSTKLNDMGQNTTDAYVDSNNGDVAVENEKIKSGSDGSHEISEVDEDGDNHEDKTIDEGENYKEVVISPTPNVEDADSQYEPLTFEVAQPKRNQLEETKTEYLDSGNANAKVDSNRELEITSKASQLQTDEPEKQETPSSELTVTEDAGQYGIAKSGRDALKETGKTNNEAQKIEETWKDDVTSQIVTTTGSARLSDAIAFTDTNIMVDKNGKAIFTRGKQDISTDKVETVLNRAVVRGRARFGQVTGRSRSHADSNRGKSNSAKLRENPLDTETTKTVIEKDEGDVKKVEEVVGKGMNVDQDALRKYAAEAFSFHSSTEKVETALSRAMVRGREHFAQKDGTTTLPLKENAALVTTSLFSTQVLPDTTSVYQEDISTPTPSQLDTVTTSLLTTVVNGEETTTVLSAVPSNEGYTETITIATESVTEMTNEYLQQMIENIEATTKSVVTSILLPSTVIDLPGTTPSSIWETDGDVTSTSATTFKPTGRQVSRGRPYQYTRRPTTPRRGHVHHRFEIQNRKRYDRRKPQVEERVEYKVTIKEDSSYHNVNNKSSVADDLKLLPEIINTTIVNAANEDGVVKPNKTYSGQSHLLNSIKVVDKVNESVTDPSFSRSANPTLAKASKDLLTTTPLSRLVRIKLRKEKPTWPQTYIFNCFGKEIRQYYSDPRDCRLFHYCTPGFTKTQLLDMKFVCDLGTYFDDIKLICTKEKPERCR